MEVGDIEQAILGYTTLDIPALDELEGTEDWSAAQWQAEFERTRALLEGFFSARDPFVILARTAMHYFIGASKLRDGSEKVRPLEQVEVEIAQALFLIGGTPSKAVPTSPGNFIRYWAMMSRHLHSFIRKQPEVDGTSDIKTTVQQKARLQTLYYRNLFTRSDCEAVLHALLTRINQPAEEALGFRLSDLYKAMVRVTELIEARMQEFVGNVVKLQSSTKRTEVIKAISFFRACYPLSDRVWRNSDDRFDELEDLRYAGFQMSEIAYPWVFTLDFEKLEANFNSSIVNALKNLALPIGGLKNIDPQHIYLNNPIWKQPYIRSDEQSLFIPLPYLAFSFPFTIIEGVIGQHSRLKKAYEKARGDELEAEIAAIISEALPSAMVYTNVVWTDPETGKDWENDVVALLGNFVFVFEAKSGGISDPARRGAELSVVRNFRDLFVEPGLQGWRLQNYLDQHRQNAVFWRKSDKSIIDFGLDRPKVVYRYSVCFEHFTTMTSARYYLKELGLVGDATAWAPAITLGELKMIARHLDTELSFQHYLTRRQSLDELIDLEGDEQDILSIYLTNGLWIDPTTIQGRKVVFLNADWPVRQNKTARQNRREPAIQGVKLSPFWASIVRELNANENQRHRFDIINVLLNQSPATLAYLERNVRRFRRGVKEREDDFLTIKYQVGRRLFILSCFFAKKRPEPEEFRQAGRHIVAMFADENTVVECASFFFLRRSKEATFDGVSFYRYGFKSKPEDAIVAQVAVDLE